MTKPAIRVKERSNPEPEFSARWKNVGERWPPSFRAVCGKPGCPGSLGRLVCPLSGGKNYLEGTDELTEKLRELGGHLGEKGRQAELSLANSGEGVSAERLDEMCSALADQIAAMGQVRQWISSEAARLWARLPDASPEELWVMVPDQPHSEPGTPRERIPRPLYYGFPDTGFRITYKGNRTREGERIARRPFRQRPGRPPRSNDAKFALAPHGQCVLPPCRIWCPVCGCLNEVELPEEFTLVEAS